MGQAERSATAFAEPSTAGSAAQASQSALASQASAQYGSRGVPADWYVDPADPLAAERYSAGTRESLDDQATAFLSDHEALERDADLRSDLRRGPAELLLPQNPQPVQPVWIGLPARKDDFSDEGELGWQTDALCAQTDPEAFFPEKGGSTRDAKKVCGACNVRSQCLEYALSNDERFGIWGGLSERERRRLRKRAV
ncbi:WhiB family transcriptional regulator [Paenarthrobacter sp. Z7-10]|uniref:WhiB family transcriptional regulator n=1 Tax=Paenarthrobacter sp. Z7-10 TaxID=2787635 RepID=UPI0022A9159A|nr:WhiB family transcriptional regulator [Paenarthrobacter sp. Z7-10]MCZ2403249.1 WhiB family transcriptional regulator [Paenarthrobacter sp. Z7-10]